MTESCQGLGIGRPRLKVELRTGGLYDKPSESPGSCSSLCLCTPRRLPPLLCQQRAAVLLSKEVKAWRTQASGLWPFSLLGPAVVWSSSQGAHVPPSNTVTPWFTDLRYSLQPFHLELCHRWVLLFQTFVFWAHLCLLLGQLPPPWLLFDQIGGHQLLCFLGLSVSSFPLPIPRPKCLGNRSCWRWPSFHIISSSSLLASWSSLSNGRDLRGKGWKRRIRGGGPKSEGILSLIFAYKNTPSSAALLLVQRGGEQGLSLSLKHSVSWCH